MSQEIHSVILNLNSNYSNNKGSNFSTIVNRQLEIKPNTLVALYKGNVVRKPIILSSDAQFSLITKGASFPTDSIRANTALSTQGTLVVNSLATADSTYSNGDIYEDITITLRKGTYSKLEFCRQLCSRANTSILAKINKRVVTGYQPSLGTDSEISFPYRFVYNEDNGQFFLGLRYHQSYNDNDNDIEQDGSFYANATTFIDLDSSITSMTNNVSPIGDIANTTAVGYQGALQATNWDTWGLGNSAIRSLCYNTSKDDAESTNAYDVGFSECQVSCPTANVAVVREAVFGLNNTYFSEELLSSGGTTPEKGDIANSRLTTEAPTLWFGCRVHTNHDGTTDPSTLITLYANEKTFDSAGDFYANADVGVTDWNNGQNVLLCEFNLDDYNMEIKDGLKLRYEIYCKDAELDFLTNNLEVNMPNRNYYMKFFIGSAYQDNLTLVYDSINYGLPINQINIETGCLFQMLQSNQDPTKNETGGLCPQFYLYNSGLTGFTIGNFRSNNVANLIDYSIIPAPVAKFRVYLPTEGYRMEVPTTNENSQQLENILRVTTDNSRKLSKISTWFNGNCYPKNKESGGMTSLGSDLSRYNIELNLPVKAYNNTESTANDIGQQRTIVFNTDPVIEDVTTINAGLVNKNIQPPDIKFLSLNNPDAIKLNDLVVQIRDSKSNNLAEEITDAGIELLFKAEVAKKPSDQIDLVL